MSDMIYKQDAIDVIRFECGEWTGLAKTIENNLNELPPAQPDYDKIIAEIKQCISETREHGKHHAKFVQDNGELYISGLEMALSIIEDVKNEKANIS